MNSLMFHERELFVNENTDEQYNGFRSRRWYSHGFEFSLRIPRSRSGNFYPVPLGLICNESEERARLFNLLYTKGLTTEQIGDISECVHSRSYSKQQVSYLANSCRDDVDCVAHPKRQVINSVAHKDKPTIASELSEVFRMEDNSGDSLWGYEHFLTFVGRWEKKYPTLKKYKAERNMAYFTYMDFPKEVQRCIYTTNWIERLNRKYKRTINMRTSMPSAQAVIFLLGPVAMEETKSAYRRKIYQFKS
uniref:transposase n=1 Tax=Prevotella ihumii TaxID=1917878 RepID=UPI001F01F9E9|nr:transposase [Prevotella ihumii]